jgi:hypothetical protein
MNEIINPEQQFIGLEHALDVLEIQFDLKLNSAKCVLGFAEAQRKTILFDGIIDLHFAPDVSDSLPWVFGGVKLEKISHEDELASGEGLWIHGGNSYAADLPYATELLLNLGIFG